MKIKTSSSYLESLSFSNMLLFLGLETREGSRPVGLPVFFPSFFFQSSCLSHSQGIWSSRTKPKGGGHRGKDSLSMVGSFVIWHLANVDPALWVMRPLEDNMETPLWWPLTEAPWMWVMPPPAGWLQPSQLLDPQQMPHIDFPVLSHPCGLLGLSPGQLPSTTIITEPHASQENVLFFGPATEGGRNGF